jgi:hypothetical protein
MDYPDLEALWVHRDRRESVENPENRVQKVQRVRWAKMVFPGRRAIREIPVLFLPVSL